MNSLDPSALTWRKARRSHDEGACVEIARSAPGTIAVRDSKHPNSAVLAFSPDEWRAFTKHLR